MIDDFIEYHLTQQALSAWPESVTEDNIIVKVMEARFKYTSGPRGVIGEETITATMMVDSDAKLDRGELIQRLPKRIVTVTLPAEDPEETGESATLEQEYMGYKYFDKVEGLQHKVAVFTITYKYDYLRD